MSKANKREKNKNINKITHIHAKILILLIKARGKKKTKTQVTWHIMCNKDKNYFSIVCKQFLWDLSYIANKRKFFF